METCGGLLLLLLRALLFVLIVVLPVWTGVSPFLVFGISWAILLVLLILLPKRA